MLQPETSTILNDGDIVTFGKAVGKGDEWVKPVVARVQLLHATAPIMALTVPSPSSEKSKSGRYGIHEAGRSSSSEDSDSNYSDIEEIPAPTLSPSTKPHEDGHATADIKLTSQFHDSSHMTSAYSAFRRLLSPAILKLPSVSEIIGDRDIGLFDSEKSFCHSFFAPVRRLDDAISVGETSPHDSQSESRINSPMELESPVPDTEVVVPRQLSISPTPVPSVLLDTHTDESAVIQESISLATVTSPCDPESSTSSPTFPQFPIADDTSSPDFSPSAPLAIDLPTEEKSSSSIEIAGIIQTLKDLETSVSKLQSSRRKYKSRFNANVSFISRKLSEIDDKFAEVDAEYNVLCDQMDGVQHRDVPDLVKQVEDLSERVEFMVSEEDDRRFETPDIQPFEEREDVKSCIKTLHDTVDEMRELHAQTQAKVSEELLEIRAMRQHAMDDIAQAKADIIAAAAAQVHIQVCSSLEVVSSDDFIQVIDHHPRQTPVPTSLKRKRYDTNEDEEVIAQGEEGISVSVGDACTGVMSETDAVIANDTAERCGMNDTDGPPACKKSRRIGLAIAQTASALTIGAVVTWSALAFS
jgi:hypothetical protein